MEVGFGGTELEEVSELPLEEAEVSEQPLKEVSGEVLTIGPNYSKLDGNFSEINAGLKDLT